MDETPRYTSASTVRSLWQEYRIFDDRVEFGTLFGELTIPFEKIERIEVSESDVAGLLRGNLQLNGFRPALKLDWANFLEHVIIDRSEGLLRRVLFTPERPEEFKQALDEALTAHRQRCDAKDAG